MLQGCSCFTPTGCRLGAAVAPPTLASSGVGAEGVAAVGADVIAQSIEGVVEGGGSVGGWPVS